MMKINDQKEKRVIQAEIILDHTHQRGLEYEKVQFSSAQIPQKKVKFGEPAFEVSRYMTIFIEFFANFLSLCILSRTKAFTNSPRIKACFHFVAMSFRQMRNASLISF